MVDGPLWLECCDCAAVRAFDRPLCVDGHGAACPEWCCTECGAAVLLGWSSGVAVDVAPSGVARRELCGAA